MAVVGIDLGTTYSAIATLDERGQPQTLPYRDGEMLTPSAVLFAGDAIVVGQAALDVALEQPERVATLIKRRMGQPAYGRQVMGFDYRPETLSAIILRKLVQDAELRIGPVKQAVITVPAYFDDSRRKATLDAGRIAGLDVLDVLDEPVAAALSYSFQPPHGHTAEMSLDRLLPTEQRTVLVYDLGGGTFDVSLVRLTQRRFQSLAIEGDVRLGGKDWDDRLVDHVASVFKKEHGEDPRTDPVALTNLQSAAERAKRNLSKLTQTKITCTHKGKVTSVTLSRADFEALTRDLLTRTRLTTQQVLRQAGATWEQVDRVLLVGGSTHMPMTRQMLQELSGKPPDQSLAVSEVVARGAAIHAGIVATRRGQPTAFAPDVREALENVVEINVISHSLGVEINRAGERVNDMLIHKNTQLPAAASRVYRTAVDNQNRVRVKVLQGEAHQSDACITIGECWIADLPASLPKGSPIQVRCGCGANGMIDVMALDMTSGKMARTEIHRAAGLAEDELEKEAAYVRGLKIQ